MKKILFTIIFLICICILNSCDLKQYFTKRDDLSFSRDTIISTNKLRESVFNKFIFDNNENIHDNIEANTINDVFKEIIRYNPFDTGRSYIPNLSLKEETLFEFKYGKKVETGIKQYIINYDTNGLIKSKFYPLKTTDPYEPYLFEYNYNVKEKINDIIGKNSKFENLFSVNFTYDSTLNVIEEKGYLLIPDTSKADYDPKSKLRFRRFSFYSLKNKDYQISYRYNKLNQITEAIKWDSDGNILFKYIYNYEPNGNIKERLLYSKNQNDKRIYLNSQTLFYQNTIELIYYTDNNIINCKLQYIFNKDFNLIEKRRINNQGNLDWKIIYTYNGTQLDKINLENWDKTLNRRIIYTYGNNLVTEKKVYDGNEKLVLKIELKYNAKGNKLEQKLSNEKNEQMYRLEYEYSENLITQKIEYDNINEPKKMYKYDYLYY